MSQAFELENLRFGWPGTKHDLLQIEHLALQTGKHLFIQGASGSGKSTLLNLLCGVLLPQSGQIRVLDQDLTQYASARRDRFRADHLGIIFQQFNLLPYLTPVQNCLLPLTFSAKRRKQCPSPEKTAIAYLQQLNLPNHLLQVPSKNLSIGQQQRVAIARALIGQPDLIIADEPTSALDAAHRDRFMQCLFEAAEEHHTSIVFVSHDLSLASEFDHQYVLPEPPGRKTEGSE
ncbi:ATP-binding cassette domain-containing protein [Hydrogenovibrio halophilus]|uniref:ATP-binding cassette domain-containing protein n=1 Tax=Hydrogenovibrio halophilus TaxID=373391 RepID=UPI00036CE735|nr:ATP-binding cassette domain-containing protein [Hydrogenovibrio halophilus]